MDHPETRIEIAPHCSLSPRGARLFLASVGLASLSVALPVTLMGFWPVLPFAGLEFALLVWALKTNLARKGQRQTIIVGPTTVCIEDHSVSPMRRSEFPRHWAQVRIRSGGSAWHPSRLTVESHGRRHELAAFLTEPERQALAAQLRRLIGRINESPTLPATVITP
ncbi:MAG: DUF2244 domain-containing protein [Gammaproteobacteria bacterium]|jgi:uncharacterized membrane protein|nr:DUF2244 domain-containing protein [Gammaproteobacteria bacterium]